ncbi:site-specific integrase [bacterium]|nr:MAG: site-specific integrase [bacterium]
MPKNDRPKRERTSHPGVYATPHPTRKNGIKPDLYFEITYRLDGKKKWEGLGWATKDNMTEGKAAIALAKLKESHKTGEGERTLKEKREKESAKAKSKKALELEEARKAITFSSFWDSHYWPLQSHKVKGSKEAETGLYNHWIKPVIGGKRFADIGEIDLQKIKSAMHKGGRAPASIKYAFSVVSQVWTLATGSGYVTAPCPTKSKNVRPPKFDNKRMRHLTPDEANLLLEGLKNRSPQSHDMALLSLYAGMRFGEIASLTWHDVDFERGIITIRNPKNKKNRAAYLNSHIREVLEPRAAQSGKGLVFKDENGERVGRISNVYRRVADELFNQGVTDHLQRVGFHTLRHTFASWLVEDGQNLYAVKELMGHSDFKMTQRYSHLAPDGLREVARSLEGKLEAKPVKLQVVNNAD